MGVAGRYSLLRERRRLTLGDGREIEFDQVVDPRARRLKLIVSERGVRLTLPRGVPAAEATRFLEAHRGWLGQQLRARDQKQSAAAGPLQFGEVGAFRLRGVETELRWSLAPRAGASLHPDHVLLSCPAPERIDRSQAALSELLLAEARRDLGGWLTKHLPSLSRAPLSVRIRPLSSLWGSLSARDGLSLDLALVLAPPPAFEYVLVHELCHLLQRNHSAAFWREVAVRFPAYAEQRAWLRSNGLGLKAELARLLGRQKAHPS